MPRIDSRPLELVNPLTGFRGLFDSAPTVLRDRAVGLNDLADQVDAFFQDWRMHQGEAMGVLFDPLRAVERLPLDKRKATYEAFRRYNAAIENGRRQTAQAIYNSGGQPLRNLLDAWKQLADMTGRKNQAAGIEVYDKALGAYRPIGRLRRFWPRQISQTVQDVLQDPYRNATTAAKWNDLVNDLLAGGHITQASEAAEFIKGYSARGQQDFFAGLEMARTEPLPESFYEYGIEGAIRYVQGWSRHLARIENFGQKKGPRGVDAFDKARAKTSHKATEEYITAVEERVHGFAEDNMMVRAVQRGNMVVTAMHLGNPATASLNLIGGSVLTLQTFGIYPTLRGAAEILTAMVTQNPGRAWSTLTSAELADSLFRAPNSVPYKSGILARQVWKSFVDLTTIPEALWKDMADFAVLRDDFLTLHTDAMQYGLTGKGDRILSRGVSIALKVGGYVPFEYFIRTNSALAGKHVLLPALRHWNRDPSSRKSRNAFAFFQRHRFDTEKLIAENGNGPETARWLLYSSNLTNGTYQIDQTPIFMDTLPGRTFGKYQKFLTQVNRLFYLSHFKPMQAALKGGESVTYKLPNGTTVVDKAGRVKPFMDALRYFMVPIFAFALLLEPLREKLFGYLAPSPGWDELAKAFENDETYEGAMMMVQKAWWSLIGLGVLGLFGNYGQVVYDLADRQRMKNPLDPPAMAPIKGVIEIFLRLAEQGTLTGRDFDEVMSQQFGQYRVPKRMAMTFENALMEDPSRETRLETWRRDAAYVKKMTRRYADAKGIEMQGSSPSRFPTNEMTRINRRIREELILGNPMAAQALFIQAMDLAEGNKQAMRVAASIKTSVRSRDPSIVSASPSQDERAAFLTWVEDRVGPANYHRILRTVDGYRSAAMDAGLMKREFMSLELQVQQAEREEAVSESLPRSILIRKQLGRAMRVRPTGGD